MEEFNRERAFNKLTKEMFFDMTKTLYPLLEKFYNQAKLSDGYIDVIKLIDLINKCFWVYYHTDMLILYNQQEEFTQNPETYPIEDWDDNEYRSPIFVELNRVKTIQETIETFGKTFVWKQQFAARPMGVYFEIVVKEQMNNLGYTLTKVKNKIDKFAKVDFIDWGKLEAFTVVLNRESFTFKEDAGQVEKATAFCKSQGLKKLSIVSLKSNGDLNIENIWKV